MDLTVSSNRLTRFPETIGKLTKLTTLRADDNQLLGLPDSLGYCSQLEELIANGNHIEFLPGKHDGSTVSEFREVGFPRRACTIVSLILLSTTLRNHWASATVTTVDGRLKLVG